MAIESEQLPVVEPMDEPLTPSVLSSAETIRWMITAYEWVYASNPLVDEIVCIEAHLNECSTFDAKCAAMAALVASLESVAVMAIQSVLIRLFRKIVDARTSDAVRVTHTRSTAHKEQLPVALDALLRTLHANRDTLDEDFSHKLEFLMDKNSDTQIAKVVRGNVMSRITKGGRVVSKAIGEWVNYCQVRQQIQKACSKHKKQRDNRSRFLRSECSRESFVYKMTLLSDCYKKAIGIA